MNGVDLVVVWPLSKFHYLSPELVMSTDLASFETASSPPIDETPGRQLAARALRAGPDCSQQRVSDLLGVSRRTIGRMAEADLSTALRDPQVLETARTCLAETASRGSTAEEREAAVVWLEAAARDEHQVARVQASRRRAGTHAHGFEKNRVRATGRRPATNGAHRNGSATPTTVTPRPKHTPGSTALHSDDIRSEALLTQVDALRRQQQRILHRSALIDYVLAAEKRNGDSLTMGDALAELLADITEAARTIGTLLQPATGRP